MGREQVRRASGRILIGFTCALASTVAFGQEATLLFQSRGPKDLWFDQRTTSTRPANRIQASGTSIAVDTTGQEGKLLIVLDLDSGNSMAVSADRLNDHGRVYTDNDFNLVGHVRVECTASGKPVPAAIVTLKDPMQSQTRRLTTADKGIADFYCVNPGASTVTVEYQSNGKAEAASQPASFDLARKDPIPTVHVALSGTTDNALPAVEATSADNSSGANRLPLVGGLAVIVVLIGAGAAAIRANRRQS